MDNRAVVERIMKNLAFEVEPILDNETIQENCTSSKLDPLNVKIKIRKIDTKEQHNRGFISNNQSQPEMVLQKVRVKTSNETLMSFDMFVEAEKNVIPHKPRKHIFNRLRPGICLGAASDEENQPYMPDVNGLKVSRGSLDSKSDGKLGQQFTLSKNNNEIYLKSPTKKIDPTFFGRKCKPGGCLDPSFGEDVYSYKPALKAPVSSEPENGNIIGQQDDRISILNDNATNKNQRKSKDTPAPLNHSIDKVRESASISNLSIMGSIENSLKTNLPEDNDAIYLYKPIVEAPLLLHSFKDNIADQQEDTAMNSKSSAKESSKNGGKFKDTFEKSGSISNSLKADPIGTSAVTYPPENVNEDIYSFIPVDDKAKTSSSFSKSSDVNPITSDITHSPEDDSKVIYSYKSAVQDPILHETDNVDIADQAEDMPMTSKLSTKSKKKSIDNSFSIIPVNDQVNTTALFSNSVNMNLIRNSVITYPPEDNNKDMKTRGASAEKFRHSIDGPINAFFTPPKGVKRDSKNQGQRNLSKEHYYNPKPITDNSVEYSPSLSNIKDEQNITSEVLGDTKPNHNLELYLNDNEVESKKSLDIPFQVDKEFLVSNMSNIDNSSLIGDTQKISITPINDKTDYPNIDDKVTSGNIGDQLSVSTHSQPPNENLVQSENKDDTNQQLIVKDEVSILESDNNINKSKVENNVDQSSNKSETENNVYQSSNKSETENNVDQSSNKSEILIIKDKINLEIKSSKDEEQNKNEETGPENNNHDTQRSNINKMSDISDKEFQNIDLDNITTNLPHSKHSIEVLSKDQQPKPESNLLETKENENGSNKNIDSKITDVSSNEVYPLNDNTPPIMNPNATDILEQPRNSDSGEQQFEIRDTEDQSKYPTEETLFPKHKEVDTVSDTHENYPRDEDKVLSSKAVVPLMDTSILTPDTNVPTQLKDRDETSLPFSDAGVTTDLKTISLSLAFQSYLNNKNEIIFKTIPNKNEVHRYPHDSITVIQSQIKVSSKENLPELSIPIDSMFNMNIKIQSNDQYQNTKNESHVTPGKIKKKPISISPPNVKTLSTTPERKSLERRVRTQEDPNDLVLHRTLTDIYERELVPLQTMIRNLKAEIDFVAEQRTILKKKMICVKK